MKQLLTLLAFLVCSNLVAAHTYNVRDYGVSCGVGFPVPNGKTTINLGLEWKHRYAAPTSLIKENYFNITLGVNFNESWFWKSKIR